jgi:hypothetical protein
MRARGAGRTGEWLDGDHVLVVDDAEHDDTSNDPPLRAIGAGGRY